MPPKSGEALGTFGTMAIISAGEKALTAVVLLQGQLWLLVSVDR